jgi:hypothetical protein
MKSQSLKLFVATLVIGIFAVGSAFAQQNLGFEIPFDFQIGEKQFDAGKYEIQKLDIAKYVLKNVETNKSMIIVTDGQVGIENSVKKEKIVFNRYGKTYFLREIYAARGTVGRGLYETKSEKRIRKGFVPNLAENKSKPEQVSINSTQ